MGFCSLVWETCVKFNDFQSSASTFTPMAQDSPQQWLTTADNMTMNHSQWCAAVEADLCWLNQLLALQIILGEWFPVDDNREDNCDDLPIWMIQRGIFVFTRKPTKPTMSQPKGGRTPGVGNSVKEETMHLLRIIKKHLSIGSKG